MLFTSRAALVAHIAATMPDEYPESMAEGFADEWVREGKAVFVSESNTASIPEPTDRYLSKLDTHKVNLANELLEIAVNDRKTAGNAPVGYLLYWPNADGYVTNLELKFQDGPVPEKGVNGVTIEALLAICADRLNGFQSGQYPNDYNAKALTSIMEALETLKARTRERQTRGVEGKLAA